MLKLSRVGSYQWEFVYPKIYNQLMEEFNNGCESFEEGYLLEAERIFKSVLAQMPDHIDAIHHLAMIRSEQDLVDQAHDLWEQSVHIGRKAFPPEFQQNQDRLEWGWLYNRPFLRCLHGLALSIYEDGKTDEALILFRELLSLNPNDNQGVRALAVEALLKLGKFEDVLEITKKYPDDMMPDTLYGQALAFFKLGLRRKANASLRKAIQYLPKVAKELLKIKHHLPKHVIAYGVEVGGVDEAYYYWERSGQFWTEDAQVLEWLRYSMKSTVALR